MELIEIYIYEVTRRLPEKNREDIALELKSTIEDMLPDDYSEDDVKSVLKKLGNPVTLASGYSERPMHLIGPRYFDVYVTLLKMMLPIAAVISFLLMMGDYFIGFHGEKSVLNIAGDIIRFGIAKMIEVGIQVFFWLTLVFAILERADKGKGNHPLTTNFKKWTPEDLKKTVIIPKKKAIKKWEVFGSFLWIAIMGTIYFYANHLIGIYHSNENGLVFGIPALNQEVLLLYWPIVVLVILLGILFAFYKFLTGRWTKKMGIINAVIELFTAIVFIVILTNPNIFNQEFTAYMADLFSTSASQFEVWLVVGSIGIFIFASAFNILEGFRKANIR
ncbi:hypothetical protein [Bacillus sp. FJAT-49736]|uniref:HAAS signaling domain-containing protein n=1 Tax=Bacillus sp. FJAT-49736 TaxID=2833582 RepID=UPI001BC9069F|nr:hypothetical protein [Bacillus sp. FJAT-49736]MBS4172748.1 hypothetical protein [Bacillus sp. FJAT-49736]